MIAAGKGGRIVNIASVLGHLGPSMHTAVAYSAAKAGLIGMTRALAVEWATLGILVNAVCPGMTETELTRGRLASKEYTDRILARVPTPWRMLPWPSSATSWSASLVRAAAASRPCST